MVFGVEALKALVTLILGLVLLEELKHIYRALLRAILSYVHRAQGDIELASISLKEALHSGIEYRSISPIMYCLPAALLAADAGHIGRAIELYSLAQL